MDKLRNMTNWATGSKKTNGEISTGTTRTGTV